MAEEWKEATSGDVLKLEEGDRIEGKFLGIEVSSMYPDSYALTIDVEGEQKVTFVNNIVHDLINRNQITPGSQIAVLYVGLKENAKGTRKYKDFKVFFK